MIVVAFGRWSGSAGRLFIRRRIYWKGYRWTPFVHIARRYRGDLPRSAEGKDLQF